MSETRSGREIDGDRLVHEGAGKQRDHRRAARAIFSMRCIRDPGEVSSVLDQHVLETASSAYQWHPALSRRLYDRMGRVRVAVRAAWPDNDRRPKSGQYVMVIDPVGS